MVYTTRLSLQFWNELLLKLNGIYNKKYLITKTQNKNEKKNFNYETTNTTLFSNHNK